MGLISWLRRLLGTDPEAIATAELSREERLQAAAEAQAVIAEAEALAQTFPHIPPHP